MEKNKQKTVRKRQSEKRKQKKKDLVTRLTERLDSLFPNTSHPKTSHYFPYIACLATIYCFTAYFSTVRLSYLRFLLLLYFSLNSAG